MIYDKLANIGQYTFKHPGLAASIQDIVLCLQEESGGSTGFTKSKISFTTASKEEKRYEAHKQFIDIHIVLEGREYVEVAHIDCLSNQTEYDRDYDIYFGDVTSGQKFSGYLESGYFLVCFPSDAHLVGAHEHAQLEVTKIVYKIAV